jgi:hypothetical protein
MKALMTLVLALLVAGCAAGRGDGAGSATTQEEPTANATEETTVYKEETTVLAIPEPPDSTLSFGGREVKGMLGSYCWSSGTSSGNSVSGCVDSIWPLIAEQAKDADRASRLRDGVPLRGAKPTENGRSRSVLAQEAPRRGAS